VRLHAHRADEEANGGEPAPESAVRAPLDVRSAALSIIAVAVGIVLLQYMGPVLIPLVLAALLFYALDPFVDAMQRWRIPRGVGAALVILVVVASAGSLTYFLQDEAVRVVERVPESLRRVRHSLQRNPRDPGVLDKVQAAAKEIETTTAERGSGRTPSGATRVQVEEPMFRASNYLWVGSMGALSLINQAVMILFLTYFMLLSDDLFKRKLVELVGPRLAEKKITVKILDDISRQVEQFLLVQAVTSAIVAVATGFVLWRLGLQGAALWGFLAGVLNSIPYYGPVIVTGGLSLVAFVQFGTVGMTTMVAGTALLITSLEGFLLTPMLLGRVAEMNKVAVFAGLIFWTWLWGVPGLLLAVPMMMVFKAVCDHVEDLQPIGRFLGE
jgi:predicted PurR-regulated permease PerM